jgi:hypothetical protein
MLDNGFVEIVKKISNEKGKDIFLEPKKLKSFLLDYAKNEYKKECSLLTAILDTDSVNFINRAENFAECKQFLVKSLEDEHSLSPQKSAEMLDLLFLVIHGKIHQVLNTEISSVKKLNNDTIELLTDFELEKKDKANYYQSIDDLTVIIRQGNLRHQLCVNGDMLIFTVDLFNNRLNNTIIVYNATN